MCTVTYLPLGNNNFILTSNRDEDPKRNTISPKDYIEDGVTLTYPKDELAGGTWIGLSDKSRLVCLLNGAFTKHNRQASYKMSRGIIVKEILKSDNAVDFIENFDFNDIEPFTIALVDWNNDLNTYELVWDGEQKHFQKLPQKPRIWSSATLYDNEMKTLRQEWFTDWLKNRETFNQIDVLKFHQDTERGHSEISLKMKRSYVETVSVTSVKKENEKVNIQYYDVIHRE